MSYRTHGEYIDEYRPSRLTPSPARCVRRTPPWGLSDARVAAILSEPSHLADYPNKCFTVVRTGLGGELPYGVVYRHDGTWHWYRANAAWVRSLSPSAGLRKCKVREDFPEVFEEGVVTVADSEPTAEDV